MSKRGYAYLRTLLIHGARSAILAAKNKIDNTQGWLTNLLERRHPNIAAVALANKNVRTVCPKPSFGQGQITSMFSDGARRGGRQLQCQSVGHLRASLV